MLCTIGDIVQDVVVWLEEDVRPATDTKSTITVRRGGSAANTAAFAGRRHPTRFIGCVGDDLAGVALTQDLERLGVDVRMQVAGTTGMIVLLVGTDGERMMFPSRGASGMIAPVDPAWLADVALVHLTGYSLAGEPSASSVIAAAERVHAAGGRVSIDVSSTGMIAGFGVERFVDVLRSLRPHFVSANLEEATLLGLHPEAPHGGWLRDLPDTVVLVRAGAEPTRILQGGQLLATVPVPPVADVIDVTGAGDAFNAGFLTSILDGSTLVQACESGHALARRVLGCPGASEPDDLTAPA